MKPFKRADRVANLIKEIIAGSMARSGDLPQVFFTTVRLSPDLKNAAVLFRVLEEPSDEEVTRLEARLNGLRARFHEELRRNLVIRNLPRLAFHYDRGLSHANRIEEILKELHLGDGEGKQTSPGPDLDE